MATIDDVYQKVANLPGAVSGVSSQVGGIAGQVGGVAGTVTGAINGIGALQDLFKVGGGGNPLNILALLKKFFEETCGNILKRPLDQLFGGVPDLDGNFVKGLLQKLAQFLGEAVVAIGTALSDAIKGVANGMADAFRGLLKKLVELLEPVWKRLVEAVSGSGKSFNDLGKHAGDFLHAFQCGPLVALQGAIKLFAFFRDLKPHVDIDLLANVEVRVKVVLQSFEALLTAAGGAAGGLFLFSEGVDAFKVLFNGLLKADADGDALLLAALQVLLSPGKIVLKILEQAVAGKWWASLELPCGLVGGKLHGWINDWAAYPAAWTDAEIALAREFRCRMVAAVDTCLRARPGASLLSGQLTISDAKLSAEALCDLACTVLDTTIAFMFEPECFPHLEIDLDGFEDVGAAFSATFARQIRVAVRGSIGLFLRGFWVWSVQNHALIEIAATLIGVAFSATLEAMLKNFTWSLQVQTRYAGDAGAGAGVYTWPSLDGATRAGGTPQYLVWYVAYVRQKRDVSVALPASLQGLLRDYGAYTDACYRQFRVERRFPNVAADTVTISRADIAGDVLTVRATTSAYDASPRPVLRAYFCCHALVMRPGATPPDPYELVFTLPRGSPRSCKVTVLSNRGGFETADARRL